MDDEKLILCVSKYDLLYNALHPKYMDYVMKENAWKDISRQMKQPAVACKQRWRALRDACRRALKKKKDKTGESAKKMKKWRFEEEMSFVIPFITEKKTHDYGEYQSDDEDPDNDDETRENDSNVSEKPYFDRGGADDLPADIDYNRIEVEVEKAVRNYPEYFPKKGRRSEMHTASAVLMERLLDQQSKSEPELDHLDRFFLSMSDTVKKFSPYQQALAKNKIFSVISEMELRLHAHPKDPSLQSTASNDTLK